MDDQLNLQYKDHGDGDGDGDLKSSNVTKSPRKPPLSHTFNQSQQHKTSSCVPVSDVRAQPSLLSGYSEDYYRDDYVVNSVHVVECESIDAEACSNGDSLLKLSAMRQAQVRADSESLDMNHIIQISISAEQTPDPNQRTGHKKNSTFTDSLSPNI